MVGWNFPGNGNGQIRGYSDAGIETFNGNELQSLARETCQNSLDAFADDKEKVIVEFEQKLVSSQNIPGYEEYKMVIENCKKYWDTQKTEKAHKFLNTAKKKISEEKIFVLRISDYNTKGLADPYGNSFEGWNSLTKVDGGSNKDGDSAGSFGVGKNAPFSNSYYRLVFYRTLNECQQKAAQGMSRLLSFPNCPMNPMDTMTVGIGYYGNPERNMPIEDISELNAINVRTEVGTDVFIYGFKGIDWEDEMISEILESFLMSIYRKKLEIKVQNTTINLKTIGGLVGRYEKKAKNAYCNYRILNEPEKVEEFCRDFHGLGSLKLRVLIDPVDKLNKKVLVVRNSGMRLFQMAGISRAISFSGILELEGIKLNEYFREMETMAHDKWEPKRHSNPKEAKEYYEELKDWVRKTVMDLGESSSDEEVEVEGLGGVLQDNEAVRESQESEDKKENLNNHLGSIEINERPKSSSKGNFFPFGNDESKSGKKHDEMGIIVPGGSMPATRTLKGQRTRKTKDKHIGKPEPGGTDIIHKKSGISTPCDLKNVRIMKLGNSNFRIIFEVPYDIEEGHIDVVTVGENGRSSKLIIIAAHVKTACSEVTVKSGSIEFKGMEGNTKVKIDYSIYDSREYAMEVNVYEHN